MGKNALTSWLVITAKDFKVLIKNKFLFLIYFAVGIAVILLALFIKFYLGNTMFRFFTPDQYLPALPNYMVYFVIFASSLYLMSQGAVSITEEHESGTADRLMTMNVGAATIYVGKFVFFYLVALLQIILFNSISTLLFWEIEGIHLMNWTVPDVLMYVFVWPFFMVLGAALLYALITVIRRATKTGK